MKKTIFILMLLAIVIGESAPVAIAQSNTPEGAKQFFDASSIIPGLSIINKSGVKSFDNFSPACPFFRNQKVASIGGKLNLDAIISSIATENELLKRVEASNTRTSRENAKTMIAPEQFLKENAIASQQVLANNYIIEIGSVENKKYPWTLYRIQVPNDAFDYVLKNRSASGMGCRLVKVCSGQFKSSKSLEECGWEFSKKANPFSLTAGVIKAKSHNTAARIGSSDIPLTNGDHFVSYRSYFDEKNNQFYSKKTGDFRIAHISKQGSRQLGNDSSLFFRVSGLKRVRPGDVLVYRPDKKMSAAVLATYAQKGWGARLDYDLITGFSRMGFAHYLMTSIGVEFINDVRPHTYIYNSNDDNSYAYTRSTDYSHVREIKAVVIPSVKIGYGLGWIFWHCFEIRPYAQIGGIMPIALTGSPKDQNYNFAPDKMLFAPDGQKQDRTNGWGFTACGGVRLALNICYPFQIVAGAEYEYSCFDKWAKELNNNVLKGYSGSRTSIPQFYAGLRWVF